MVIDLNTKLGQTIKELRPNEFVALTKIYTHKDFPYNSSTLSNIMDGVGCSKPTATRILKSLKELNLIYEVRDFVVFYYPVKDRTRAQGIRKALMQRLGLF